MQWDILSKELPKTAEQVVDLLLHNRGVDADATLQFFSPKHPNDLTLEEVGIDPVQIQRAVARIKQAKQNKEYVVVFGDYDADGVTATAILWETLYEMGVKAMPFIPNREKHGYGISNRSLDDLLVDKKPDLIITVDNGIVAHPALERLQREGIDAIITDHHLPETKNEGSNFPPALAVVHSTKLCGATTAWFLARELNRQKAAELLDLCVIGTIADQMILLDANRSFAFHGLEALRKTKRIGLLNLYELADVKPEDITSYSINFAIAPRINAMGRLGSALDALRALCTKDKEKSLQLIQILQTTNTQRQELTWSMVDGALKRANEWEHEKLIVLSSKEYHEGVIGLIAGKLVEEFAKPAIVISVGENVAKASSRSVSGINIVELIRQVRDELIDVGGHPMAAGFSLQSDKITSVTERLQKLAQQQIESALLIPRITVEALLSLELVKTDLINALKRFEPFGNGNTDPVFGFQNLQIVQAYALGREKKHLKMVIGNDDGMTVECIGFGWGYLEQEILQAKKVDIAGTVGINEWNGKKSVQMVIKDVVITD
ncbi:MAG: single-stranded-DNA-specific exonuclease RecJ [Patescibacteria group bacterium]